MKRKLANVATTHPQPNNVGVPSAVKRQKLDQETVRSSSAGRKPPSTTTTPSLPSSWLTRQRKKAVTSHWFNPPRIYSSTKIPSTSTSSSSTAFSSLFTENNHFMSDSEDDYNDDDDDDEEDVPYDRVDPLIFTNSDAQLQFSMGLVNPDELSYEQLLELEEKIGNVKVAYSKESINAASEVKQLQKLDIMKLRHSGQDRCPICLEKFITGSKIRKLRCGHSFHTPTCIDVWLEHSKWCPTCKLEICIEKEEISPPANKATAAEARQQQQQPQPQPQPQSQKEKKLIGIKHTPNERNHHHTVHRRRRHYF